MYVQIRVLAFLIFLGFDFQLTAQPVEVGFSAGFNISTHAEKFRYTGDVALTPNRAAGYQAGLFVRKEVFDQLKIQVEPTFIKLGSRYSEPFSFQGDNYQTESWTKLLYLQFPLLVHYTPDFLESERFGNSYHISGGFFMGYLLDAHFIGNNSSAGGTDVLPLEGYFSNDVTIQYSKYDGGLIVGAGVEYAQKIGFETRLQYTLYQSYQGNPIYKPKNLAVTLSLVYLL